MNKTIKKGRFLFFIVVLVTFFTIYFTVDISTFKTITEFSLLNIFFALVALAIGMYFDGLRLQVLAKMSGYKILLPGVMQVIFGNYFLAMLTPGAVGGAVAQVLVLRNIGVPFAQGSMIAIIRTFFSILFLIFMMPFVFLYDSIQIPYVETNLLFYCAIFFIFAVLFSLFFLQSNLMKRFVYKMALMFHLSTKKLKYLLNFRNDLNKTLLKLCRSPLQSILVFLYSGFSLLFLYAIVPALLFNLSSFDNIGVILGRMMVLNLILYFAPTPGGTGFAEGLFVLFFKEFSPPGFVGIIAVMWRIIAEYIPFFIGMYFIINIFGRKYLTSLNKEDVE